MTEFDKTATKNVLGLIEVLKQWRKLLWDAGFNNSTAILVPVLDDFSGMQNVAEHSKQFISAEIYESFVRELSMTVFLLHKCLIKSLNSGIVGGREEEIKALISKLSAKEQTFENKEATLEALREEDPTLKEVLRTLGCSQEIQKKLKDSGFAVESVLDVEPVAELKK